MESRIVFAQAVGGYPDSTNSGNSNAITDETSQFYVDTPKNVNFETIIFSDTSAGMVLLDYGQIAGISVNIKNASSTEEATVQVALYHTEDGAYTDNIELDGPSSATNIVVGSPTQLWGKSWTTNDIHNLRVKIHSPVEPAGGIALIATFLDVTIFHEYIKQPGKLTLGTGKLVLNQGKVIL